MNSQILERFAYLLGTEVKNGRLEIPEEFGRGYCSGFVFNKYIKMFIFNYELDKDLVIEDPESHSTRTILFKFENIFPVKTGLHPEIKLKLQPTVLIATRNMNSDLIIPIHSNTATINIEIDTDYLDGLFDQLEKKLVLKSLLENKKNLLFEQIICPGIEKVVEEIVSEYVVETFRHFFLRLKAEELVCRLLMELERREEKQLCDLKEKDIENIYKVKTQMLLDLQTVPVIKELAVFAGMSPTKLKRLFKQIFGESIFNYYQKFRMKEAAFLLKNTKLAVSDVGYKLGFSNLGHFSRVFKEHIGMRPKEYSKTHGMVLKGV